MIQNDSSYLDPPFGMPAKMDGTWGALAGGSEDTSPAFNTGSPTGGEAEEDSPNSPEVEQVGTVRTFFSQDSALRHQHLNQRVPSLNPMGDGKSTPFFRHHLAPKLEGPGICVFDV